MNAKVSSTHRKSKERYIDLAGQAKKNEEYQDALDFYDKALHIDRDDLGTWVLKGKLCILIEQYDNAINCFDQALNLDPENFEAVFQKARALDGTGNQADALQQYARAIRLEATDPRPHFFKGVLLGNTGKHKEAIESLDQCLRYEPNRSHAWFYKGCCHQDLEQYREALAAYDRAVSISSEDYDPVMARGKLRALLSDYTKAIEDFDRAKELKERSCEPYYAEGLVLDLMGRNERSEKVLEEGVRVAEGSSEDNLLKAKIHFQLALLLESRCQSLLAFQHATAARDLDPSDEDYLNYHQLLSMEYHADPKHVFLIDQLDSLQSADCNRVGSALKALLEKGDNRTLDPVIATLYDSRLIAGRLLETAPEEIRPEIEEAIGSFFSGNDTVMIDPWKLKDGIVRELDNVMGRYTSAGDDGIDHKMVGIMEKIKKELNGDKKELLSAIGEFSQLISLHPRGDLLLFLILLIVLSGGNYVLLLNHAKQAHLLELTENTEHVKRTVFGRFSFTTSSFRERAKNCFSSTRKEIIDAAKRQIETDLVGSMSRARKDDTWLTFGGGDR